MKSDSHTCWIHETRPGRTLPRVSGPNPWSSPQPQVTGSRSAVSGLRNEPARDDSHSENPTFHPPYQSDTTGPVRRHRTRFLSNPDEFDANGPFRPFASTS